MWVGGWRDERRDIRSTPLSKGKTMDITATPVRRAAASIVVAVSLVAGSQAVAYARQDLSGSCSRTGIIKPNYTVLERIGRQLVRGDNLTGAGVTAPLAVPEQQ
jgi:hypothetical protein